MQRRTKHNKKGFTIVEVTIVTAFVAMLLIAITVIITQMAALFQKGLTLNAISTVGRNLVSEFTTAINSAPSIDSTSLCNMYVNATATDETDRMRCIQNGAFNFIYQERTGLGHDSAAGGATVPVQYGGVFCTGYYSYVWNTWYGMEEGRTIKLRYRGSGGEIVRDYDPGLNARGNRIPFQLLRFEDRTYRACTQSVKKDYSIKDEFYNTAEYEIDMRTLANGAPNVMPTPQEGFLENSESDTNLDLYEFVIYPVSQDAVTLRAFFAGSFILATNSGDVNIVRSGDYCDPAANGLDTSGNLLDLGSRFNYCGINKFNFAARSAGSSV